MESASQQLQALLLSLALLDFAVVLSAFVEEAVGDCYENLALWHLKHSKDAAAAKDAAKKSQDYYPGARRPGAIRHLRAAERLLQGK